MQFDDLPRWEFSSLEMSPGIYYVRCVRDGEIVGESTGSDHDALLSDLKQWAHRIEAGLPSQPS